MTREELVEKYKAIYKEKTSKDLPDDEAWNQALKLVQLVDAVHPLYAKKI